MSDTGHHHQSADPNSPQADGNPMDPEFPKNKRTADGDPMVGSDEIIEEGNEDGNEDGNEEDANHLDPSGVEAQPTPNRLKRRRLNLAEKLRALDLLANGMSLQEVADEYGASKRAIMRMKQEGDVIRSLGQSGVRGSMKSRKQSNCVKYTALEAKVVEVLDISRRNRMTITFDLVRSCSLRVRQEMLKQEGLTEEQTKDLQEFNPSDNWIRSFARRKQVKVASKPWRVAEISAIEVDDVETQNVKTLLQRYDLDCIFSVHETTLFHKVLPRKSYLVSRGPGQTSAKALPDDMTTEDRLTLIVCTNATGTVKIPLALIGMAKQPKCFRIRPCPLHYLTHPFTWFNSTTFKQWFSEIFIPAIRHHTWRNIALLVENSLDGHNVSDPRGQVHILHLPAEKQRSHPMEQGITSLLKQKYRYSMLERVIQLLPVREEIQSCTRKPPQFRGLDDGSDPNILDSAELLETIWKNTSDQSIARNWVSAVILPDSYNAKLTALHGRSQAYGRIELLSESCTAQENEMVHRVEEVLRSRNLTVQDSAPLGHQELVRNLNSVTEREFESWLSLEDKPDIKATLVREAQENLLTSTTLNLSQGPAGTVEITTDLQSDECDPFEAQQQLPSLAAIAEMFAPIEELISVCDAGPAASHIRLAKRHLFQSKMREARIDLAGSARGPPPVTAPQEPSG
eukprot:GFKZ01000313.1.p1 GENE.GFKZ01000313.1~~GFKZ01000313.1.p1  ORF type:complete len:683 (-),score=82.21 GFKZ01000313.1:75-2123(-)